MKRFALLLTMLLAIFGPIFCTSPYTGKTPQIKLLIVDGFSNHDWQETTRVIVDILAETGLFRVDVSTSPPTAEAEGWDDWRPKFADYDVMIQNCNSLGGRPLWPREVEISLEKYMQEGGGLYILHSANNAFPHWEAYNQMIGLGWRKADQGWALTINEDGTLNRIPPGEGKATYHGPRVDAVIEVLGSHPIHKGFPDNWPIEWVISYGKGRVYNSTFGHIWKNETYPETMRCLGIQSSLIRALEWLAKEEVSWPLPDPFPSETEFVIKPL